MPLPTCLPTRIPLDEALLSVKETLNASRPMQECPEDVILVGRAGFHSTTAQLHPANSVAARELDMQRMDGAASLWTQGQELGYHGG